MSDKKKKVVKEAVKLIGVGFDPKGTKIVHDSTIKVAKRVDPETLTKRLQPLYAKLKEKESMPLSALADSPHEKWSVRMLVGLGFAEAIPPKKEPKAEPKKAAKVTTKSTASKRLRKAA